MPLRPNMEPREYLEVFLRRKWLVLVSIVLVMLGAAVYCVVIPDRYLSSTTILVIPPSVSANYVRPLQNYPLQERILSIQQQVLSRTRLIKVMEELGLYKEERKKASAESLVGEMRKKIEITGIRGKNAFSLSFKHVDPKLAMLTASKLASFFIEENIRTKEQQAVSTSGFLESQLKETKERLEAQEEKLKHYKLTYMGELPQQMQANISAMSRLQDQLRTNADSRARLEDRKVFLESKISDLQKEIGAIEGQVGSPEDPSEGLMAEIAARQKKIRELSLKYTSNYPTVRQLQREVDELKDKVESVRKSGPFQKGRLDQDPSPREAVPQLAVRERGEVRRMREQIANLNLEISSLKKESEEARRSIDSIQGKVGRLPQREQEMISLTRDYENTKEAYQGLLKKKLEAEVSKDLEEDQMGETFQVLDPATFPSTPYEPDRLKILGMAFLAAIALGFGGAIGWELLDPTLQGPKDFKHFFNFPILATLPVIQADGSDRIEWNLRTVLLIGLCSVLSAVTVILLVYRDHIRAILQTAGGIG